MPQLFYVDAVPEISGALIESNAHHANVVRLNSGEEILVSDGVGNWARCRIDSIGKKEVSFSVQERGFEEESKYEVSVLQALPKSDRAKETIELLTEAGVKKIYPWQSERSIGKSSERWGAYALEAGKQSRRFWAPQLSNTLTTEEAKVVSRDYDQVLVCHESASRRMVEVVRKVTRTLIVIGPEGGLTAEEAEGFEGEIVKMGRPILRTAHAGIAAISAVSALMDVW